ncbi:hypothetical protein A3D07_01375 [Candidatus Curtissbacteria bacterium RIFCSPHIGHO2_02_FULL_42_15]|uniref:VOC domain-containing protein n=1 Tax=Candidatus Curtissbacteria bacterium RIFCSPHIGHO2_02_FULL_42_15 TaxID=1797716 RepID=A0A1F5GHG5_9BACT|nr:MAG: hypothetical protein A3D07_01375 [Candidatus Curtissbacteria bacterium RIFCSPHIGHO2_02_FULL_42_15]
MDKNTQRYKQSFSTNKVIHFEIAVSDFERAKKFYSSLFDWKFLTWVEGETDYVLIQTVGTDDKGMPQEPGAINGGMFKRPSKRAEGEGENAFVCTVEVEDIDETLKKVEDAGGKVIMPKREVPGIGFSARCFDLDGNIFGLLQPAR